MANEYDLLIYQCRLKKSALYRILKEEFGIETAKINIPLLELEYKLAEYVHYRKRVSALPFFDEKIMKIVRTFRINFMDYESRCSKKSKNIIYYFCVFKVWYDFAKHISVREFMSQMRKKQSPPVSKNPDNSSIWEDDVYQAASIAGASPDNWYVQGIIRHPNLEKHDLIILIGSFKHQEELIEQAGGGEAVLSKDFFTPHYGLFK